MKYSMSFRHNRERHRSGCKGGELVGDLPQQLHLTQHGADALIEHDAKGAIGVLMDMLEVFRGQLNRCQRVLDVMRHLARHVGPCLQFVRPPQFGSLFAQRHRHAVEVVDQPPQFVSGVRDDAHVKAAGREKNLKLIYANAAAAQNDTRYLSLWCGQAGRLARDLPAGELMNQLVREIADARARIASG